ncbi:MAG: hypothetical protein H0W61_00545 [Bacteroidetes bacterium]|nr:hypothetical protein [Bacteroidota bacterium]
MKKLTLLFLFAISFLNGISQSDTLFTDSKKKIPCKIYEINEYEIKYRRAESTDGPIYVIDKSTVIKYSLSNGFTELLKHDELSLENEHKEILGSREVIKINPFSFAFNHVSVGYEKVVKVGTNLDVEAGYINSSISPNQGISLSGRISQNPFYSGAYIKPGVKFFLGEDFSVKGLKYAHPLKGRYIRLDLAFSFVNYQGFEKMVYTGSYPNYATSIVKSDLKTFAYGGFVNYGRQFILGNVLTLDYYMGVGFTGQSYSYTNPLYTSLSSNYGGGYYNNEINQVYNYHGFLRIPVIGLSWTAGLRLGYIIPEKKSEKKRNTTSGTGN